MVFVGTLKPFNADMLKMKLPLRTGKETAKDESPLGRSGNQRVHMALCPSSVSQLDKETVFEWFGLHLNPAKRIEFMCGLMHMCQPLELRFLGSYLEDLARKDYHVLRDFEFRANNPSDWSVLTDVFDPVVRSKLLVSLPLLGTDSRECAGMLFRILNRVDPLSFYNECDWSHPPGPDGTETRRCAAEAAAGPLEQLALLFTMASLHPAFHFHQRETIRGQLDKIEQALEEERRQTHCGAPVKSRGPVTTI